MKVDNLYIIKDVQSLLYGDYCTNGSLKKFYNSIQDLSSVSLCVFMVFTLVYFYRTDEYMDPTITPLLVFVFIVFYISFGLLTSGFCLFVLRFVFDYRVDYDKIKEYKFIVSIYKLVDCTTRLLFGIYLSKFSLKHTNVITIFSLTSVCLVFMLRICNLI
ncbi:MULTISPECIES: hypothetical protein [Clostridium]|jgi:hypothetical protein|uniref:hypothetical protein n=1 Tax=Clostridium TaxID=1485 RepID=UPI002908E709|nr:hypothetical protein [Clostridium sp.]MDU4738682.1 hypothetical protein [Clostridium sp.]